MLSSYVALLCCNFVYSTVYIFILYWEKKEILIAWRAVCKYAHVHKPVFVTADCAI